MLVRIAICDDEAYIVEQLYETIQKVNLGQHQTTIYRFHSPEELRENIVKGVAFDVIFLDIEMGSTSGIDLALLLREKYLNNATQLIYVSGYETYFQELIETVPSGFIRKPFQAAEVERMLKKAVVRLQRVKSGSDYFYYKALNVKRRVRYSDILYFESELREMHLHTRTLRDTFYSTMDELMERLDSRRFLRCHKSFVINLEHMRSCAKKEITLSNGVCIPIGSARSKEVHKHIADYIEDRI